MIKHNYFKDWISKQSWIFSKTFANTAPHEYLVKGKLLPEDQKVFLKFAQFIRDNGYKKKFGGRTYIYYDIDGNTYWTMGAALNITIILNRAIIGGKTDEHKEN